MSEINIKINRIEYKHIYEVVVKVFEIIRPTFCYTIDNLKTFALTAHPAFSIWLAAVHFAGLGNEVTKHNAMEEIFGTEEFGEGNHSQLCRKYISQLGDYKLEHFTRCSKSLEIVNSHMTLNKIKILYSFLVVIELASFFIEDIQSFMIQQPCVKDHTYSKVHLQVDNHDDGHGIMMLQSLEENKISVDDFNSGLNLFILFFSDIFKKL